MSGSNTPFYVPRGLETGGGNRNSDYERDRILRNRETSCSGEVTRSGRYFGEPSDPELPPNRFYIHGFLPEPPAPLNTRLDSEASASSTPSGYKTGILAGDVCSTDSCGPDYEYPGTPKSNCTDETVQNDRDEDKHAEDMKRETLLLELQEKPDLCLMLLNGMKYRLEGWCRLATKKGNQDGYVRISWRGTADLVQVHILALWSKGLYNSTGTFEASHRCHQPACFNPDHLLWEPHAVNMARKACIVWVDPPICFNCHKCSSEEGKKIHMCTHGVPGDEENTICIKFVSGYNSHQHLMREEGLYVPNFFVTGN